VAAKDYSTVTNEECGQVHSESVSVAEMSARLLSDTAVFAPVDSTFVVELSAIIDSE